MKNTGYVKEPLFRAKPDPDGGELNEELIDLAGITAGRGAAVPVSASFQCPGCGAKVVFVGTAPARVANTASWSGVPCSNCGATYTVDLEVDPPQSDPAKEVAR
jgi:hypothetical protein